MTTPAKLYGKDLSEYDDVDVDSLLAQLSAEEINILAKEVDPDVRIFWTILTETFFNSCKLKFPLLSNILGQFPASQPAPQLRV